MTAHISSLFGKLLFNIKQPKNDFPLIIPQPLVLRVCDKLKQHSDKRSKRLSFIDSYILNVCVIAVNRCLRYSERERDREKWGEREKKRNNCGISRSFFALCIYRTSVNATNNQ